MRRLMPDSQLNRAERGVQQSFRKSSVFNGLLMIVAVAAAYLPMRSLPARMALPPVNAPLPSRPVELAAVSGPLKLAGAWQVQGPDWRFGGLSSLTVDNGRFLAVSDRGAVTRFDPPGVAHPQAWVADLREGPGPWGRKWSRDAESLVADPGGRGWWVGYEQNHSLWLYDGGLRQALARIDLKRPDWWDNRGAEGLVTDGQRLLVMAENGREAMLADKDAIQRLKLEAGADVGEATRAPDGSLWLMLRSKSLGGIEQSIVRLTRTDGGYRAGPKMAVPKGAFDNFEGMAIEARPGGAWRFWLISDDGHRIMARTLLVALDYVPPAGQDKSPATRAGLSRKPEVVSR